ncbi:conjugal transfer protein TraB [Photobacterium damselae]|uniref:Conjugal transfer pilus assembly protein TraB n=1 Tax=Photobacterium damselae TaxID=38293 RepID=A0A2T3Q347_PHODM|nr:conjugal transfer protein TraB [Photobacterium damselae]SPY46052.1 conjugal transfer pilus assembly protein TraB [Photobacterium damselae]
MGILDLFTRKGAQSLDEAPSFLEEDNVSTRTKNWTLFGIVLLFFGLCGLVFWLINKPKETFVPPSPDFEPVITEDFTDKDAKSALQAQQRTIIALEKSVSELKKERQRLSEQVATGLDRLEQRLNDNSEETERLINNNLDAFRDSATTDPSNSVTPSLDPFGSLDQYPQVPTAPRGYLDDHSLKDIPTTTRRGIQTFSYRWPKMASETTYRRTSDNYVPTGSFVTAVLMGAADANAGVNAQGDTAPIVFRTIHEGILPNGKRSRIKDCFVTASVYGEISSNRGIARLNRMSCIFDEDGEEDILDIPVRGTAFSFARNGMRGTPVMRNGKIIQMAGISGLFTGLGDTAKNASSSTITGPSGVVSTVDPSKALLNMGGSALENIGSKLADYYIKLAEQYHPIIELNPGSVVNLVFLEGFPLDPLMRDGYEQRLSAQEVPQSVGDMASQLMTNMMNPLAAQPTLPTNPLKQQLSAQLQQKANQFDATTQSPPQPVYSPY